MKKVKNSTDIHQKQGQELSKKLYRSTTEQAKRLDDARSCARTINDLFTPSLQIQRRKFCDYCERLIFSDPILYGKKGEELLWRKGYYDVVSTVKKLKKKEYTLEETCNFETHVNAGIGFYHHFIVKLQCEFNLNLTNVIDFSMREVCYDGNNIKEEISEWAKQAVHQCLIYLGDLSRYKLEFTPKLEPTLAFRYYLQAISFKSDHGMPHNQMGTLAMNQNKFLDAVYHYMRCLGCTVSFEGTTNNLHSLFDKNSKYLEQLPLEDDNEKGDHLKRFIARFLLLIDIWYFNKKVNKVYSLCHQTYKDLEQCLSLLKPSSETCESPTENESIETDSDKNIDHLSNDMIFKIVVICLLCISKLHKLNHHQASTAVAFTLAIYSQLVQNVTYHIQESVLNYPLPEVEVKIEQNGIVKDLLKKNKKKRSASKLRRRKALPIESESEDDSEDNAEKDQESSLSSDDSFVSDDEEDAENILAQSSDDEEDEEGKVDKSVAETEETKQNGTEEEKVDVIKKIKRMDVNDMLEIITEQGSLQAIKIINDWLMHDTEIVKSCGTNTRSLLRQITNMLNLININIKSSKLSGIKLDIINVIKNEEKIPLAEDVILKGVEILNKPHKNLDWNYLHKHGMNIKEESVTRIIKFLAFGKFLTGIDETGISFDENKNIFVCKSDENEEGKTTSNAIVEDLEIQEAENPSVITDKLDDKDSDSKGQLMKMKHMGQLWLASEVRALENRVRGKTSLSPYLVLDADALIKYTFMVKHFVHSRKFIVLIPSAVVSALDDLKREQSEARDAIRWLESQFHRGNRFFRAQRPQERAPIPFIKYPKKKDKEMSTYIQIIECCYFLAQQQKGASNLITLLIGNQNVLSNGENKEFSYVGLAQSAGVSIESITHFYSKWKKSYKARR